MKIVRIDHRKYPRVLPSKPIEAICTIDGATVKAEVAEYAHEGMRLRLSSKPLKELSSKDFRVKIEIAGSKLEGWLRHSDIHNGHAEAGVFIPALESANDFSDNQEDGEVISKPETLKQVFDDLVSKGPECLVDIRQLGGHGILIPISIEENGSLIKFELWETQRGHVEPGHARLTFDLFQTCHSFQARVRHMEGKFLFMELPKTLVRILRRDTVRLSAKEKGKGYRLDVSSSDLSLSIKGLEVVDFSEHGLAVIDPEQRLYGPSSMQLENLTLKIDSKRTIKGKGIIRTLRWSKEHNNFIVGLEFNIENEHERSTWYGEVLSTRYPALKFNYDESYSDIWSLFDRSGYFRGLKEGKFRTNKKSTLKSWTQTKKIAPSSTFRIVHMGKSGNVSGHIQLDKIYPKSWVVHHFALDVDTHRRVARDFFSGMFDFLRGHSNDYMVCYTKADKGWNQRVYYAMVMNYPDRNYNILSEVAKFHISAKKFANSKQNLNVRVLTPKDQAAWDLLVDPEFSNIEKSALDLSNLSEVFEDGNSSLTQRVLPGRKKRVFGYYQEGKLLAGVIAEIGPKRHNCLGVLDLAHLIFNKELDADARTKIADALLTEASGFYLENGRDEYMLSTAATPFLDLDDSHYSYLHLAYRWTASCEAVKRYYSYNQRYFERFSKKD